MDKRRRDSLRSAAWSEYLYPRAATGRLADPSEAFLRTARVYEHELEAALKENAELIRRNTEATALVREMLSQLVSGPERGDAEAILEALTGGMIYQPWDFDTVIALNRYQVSGIAHPYTCPQGDTMTATRTGWSCVLCGHKQDWAHALSLKTSGEGDLS